ncbi:MAG: 4Fe-4S dicluster domain-containing protein [Syntrophales bacterium LBB04]|nr:4Fe-4S dicluster domain-containing protein [Syntrophales bacterium LBB04]
MKGYAILHVTTFCTGCNTCGYRCVQEFRYHDQASKGFFRTFVQTNDEGLYQKRCMHCLDPQCVKACPAGALTKSEYGPVLFDKDKCVGAKACVDACPFNHIPQFDPATQKIIKCSMCAHRITENKQPACVEVCPTGALQFGDYKEMQTLAKNLAKKNKLQVYGLDENGGTHLFILTKGSAVAMGYPKVAKKPPKAKKASMEGALALPGIAALAYAGFKKFSDRRSRVEAETKNESQE